MPAMTAEEKNEFNVMKRGMEEIQKDIEQIKFALIGNVLAGEEGLVGKINKVEVKQDHLESEVRLLRDERIRNSVYIKIIIWLLCIIGTGCIGFIVNTALNK